MTNVDKNLAEILNTDYVPSSSEKSEKNNNLIIQDQKEPDNNPDAEYSRANYYNLIEKGNEALDGILDVARESQHPRAYEVAANMIKNLSDVTEKLMILQKQKLELQPREAAPTNISVDKAVFVGSTAELLRKLKNENV